MSAPDRYVVAGNPVAHSRSPFIHGAFAAATGQTMTYERLLVPLDAFDPTIRALAASGAKGCNITLPFKQAAFQIARRQSERAALAGAANLLRFDAEGWFADNTDGIGLVHDITANAGVALAGRRVLLIGAGGAAAGALGPLLAARPQQLTVANRTLASAEALVERHRAVAGQCGLTACALDACTTPFDIVINASSSSLQQAAVPVAAAVLAPGGLALDMMYGAAARPFVEWAETHGARGRDGLGMLVEQAAVAFACWRGVSPDTRSVLAALRARIDSGG